LATSKTGVTCVIPADTRSPARTK